MTPGTICVVLWDVPPNSRKGQMVTIAGPLTPGPFFGTNGEYRNDPMYPVEVEDREQGCFYPPSWLLPMPPRADKHLVVKAKEAA